MIGEAGTVAALIAAALHRASLAANGATDAAEEAEAAGLGAAALYRHYLAAVGYRQVAEDAARAIAAIADALEWAGRPATDGVEDARTAAADHVADTSAAVRRIIAAEERRKVAAM